MSCIWRVLSVTTSKPSASAPPSVLALKWFVYVSRLQSRAPQPLGAELGYGWIPEFRSPGLVTFLPFTDI